MIRAMEQVGAKPKYVEYSDLGHSGPCSRAVREPEFLDWLFSQSLQ